MSAIASLRLDSAGNPAIGYFDANNPVPRSARWTGASWQIESVSNARAIVDGMSLALGPADHPFISFHDSNSLGWLNLALSNGTTWEVENVDTGPVYHESLAIDPAGNPAISHSNAGEIKLARRDGASWNIHTIETFPYSVYDDSASLALDRAGNPAIAYTGHGLKFARQDGASWNIETVDSGGWDASLALDGSGNPIIAYVHADEYGNPALNVARWDGTRWNLEVIESRDPDMPAKNGQNGAFCAREMRHDS